MHMDFSTPGKLFVSMEPYIKSMLDEMPSDMFVRSVNPTASHLFNINATNPEYLTADESRLFVHMVKLVYIKTNAAQLGF
jgi:hypothetical protein